MKNIKTYENFNKKTISDYIDKLTYHVDVGNIIFSCSDNFIESLDGIEKFTQLEKFYCSQNKITSLEGVENLTKLEYLSISNNDVTSLKGIENLSNLKFLYIRKNKITSLKPLENLTKLKTLGVENNPIDWIDYIDKKGNTWYTVLPKSITVLDSDNFSTTDEYWEFMEKNQPVGISRKFNF